MIELTEIGCSVNMWISHLHIVAIRHENSNKCWVLLTSGRALGIKGSAKEVSNYINQAIQELNGIC